MKITETYDLSLRNLLERYRIEMGIEKNPRHELSIHISLFLLVLARADEIEKKNLDVRRLLNTPVSKIIKSLKRNDYHSLLESLLLVIEAVETDKKHL